MVKYIEMGVDMSQDIQTTGHTSQDIEMMEVDMPQETPIEIDYPDKNDEGETSFSEDEKPEDWRDLPTNEWFLITHQRSVLCENGMKKILNLKHQDSTIRKVWTTTIISSSIDEVQKNRSRLHQHPDRAHLFIKSLGKRLSKTNPDRVYFDFRLKYL